MPNLKAWEQGSGEPAHRQVVQGPLGHSAREGLHPDVTDLIVVKVEILELWERPAGTCVSKRLHPVVTDGIEAKMERCERCQRPLAKKQA